MADAPCSCCDTGYSGRAFIAYVNFYDGDDLVQCRLRLCQNCIADHFLILVENGDKRNERNVWISAREMNGWRTDAHLGITETVKAVAISSRQTSETTSMSLGAGDTKSTSSAANAGSESQSPPQQSSQHSRMQASERPIGKRSANSSETTSSSESKPKSSGQARRATKSTGS